MVDEKQFFAALGQRVKRLRKSKGFTQEDMIGFGFSARHWQQMEAGRPITVTTLLRICDAFSIRVGQLIEGLDRGIYGKNRNVLRKISLHQRFGTLESNRERQS